MDSWDEPEASTDVTVKQSGGKTVATQPGAAPVPRKPGPKVPPAPVKDDWDDDDDEDEGVVVDGAALQERNRQLWDDANSKKAAPMPEVVLTNARTPSLPLNQPPQMKILKRPSPASTTTPSPTSSTPNSPPSTLEERSRRYQAARDRIFGKTE